MPTNFDETEVVAGEVVPTPVQEAVNEVPNDASGPAPETPPPKPKRTRKKKAEESAPVSEVPGEQNQVPEAVQQTPAADAAPSRRAAQSILTVEAGGEIETAEDRADVAWHEIYSAYRTRRILTGILGGLESNEAGKTLAIVDYKGYRVVIPLKEMYPGFPKYVRESEIKDFMIRQNKILSSMMGCEVDFVVMGVESKSRSIVASRAEAMMRKRRLFYYEPDNDGNIRVQAGQKVQARIIGTAEKIIRVEVFGVECAIGARDLSWEWIGDARDHFHVGEHILVRVLEIDRKDPENMTIRADVKSVSGDRPNNLDLCRIQSKYVGTVTDIHKGVVYLRLSNGVNAIAHSCYARRTPGKKDTVTFVVTSLDDERYVALGIITRIIRQNL